MEFSEIVGVYEQRRKELDRKLNENAFIDRQIAEKKVVFEKAEHDLKIGQEALKFVEEVAASRRGTVLKPIEEILTRAVRMIYGDRYSVILEYDVKRNLSSLEFLVAKETPAGQVVRGIDGIGGGMSDTISTALRMLVLNNSKGTANVCILDEAFKHADQEMVEPVAEFLRELTKLLGIQLIFSSHHAIMKEYAEKIFTIQTS